MTVTNSELKRLFNQYVFLTVSFHLENHLNLNQYLHHTLFYFIEICVYFRPLCMFPRSVMTSITLFVRLQTTEPLRLPDFDLN